MAIFDLLKDNGPGQVIWPLQMFVTPGASSVLILQVKGELSIT